MARKNAAERTIREDDVVHIKVEPQVHVPEGTTWQGDIQGEHVRIGPGACVAGNVHAEGDIHVGAGTRMEGNVVATGRVLVGAGAILRHVVCSAVAFEGPARIEGDLVVGAGVKGLPRPESTVFLRHDQEVLGALVTDRRALVEGKRPALRIHAAKGIELRPSTCVASVFTHGDLLIGAGCEIGHAEARGRVLAGEGVLVAYLRSHGSVAAGSRFHFERIHAPSVELGAGANAAGDREPRGRILADAGAVKLGPEAQVRHVQAREGVETGADGVITRIDAGGDVALGARCSIEVALAGARVVVGEGARVQHVVARVVELRRDSRATAAFAREDLVVYAGARAHALTSGGALRFTGAAHVEGPLIAAGAGGILWDPAAPPLVWGRPLEPSHVVSLLPDGVLAPSGGERWLAGSLLDHHLLAALQSWGEHPRAA